MSPKRNLNPKLLDSEFKEYRVLPADKVFAVRRKLLRRLWRQHKKTGPGASVQRAARDSTKSE